jgi:rubrerythrin
MFIIKEGTPADKIGEGTDPNTLKSIESFLAKSGYVVRTADAEKSFLESHTQREIDSVTSRFATDLEKDVKTLTGLDKQANEKYYDYFKRATQAKFQKISELEQKIADYEKKGGAGSEQIINDLKNQLQSAQQTYTQALAEKDKSLNELKSQYFGTQLNGAWERSIGTMRPKFIDNQFLNSELEIRKAKFFGDHIAEESNGQIIYKKKSDGKVLISTKDGKPKSTDEIVDELYKDLIDKKKTQGGSGSGGGGNGGEGGNGGNPPPPDKYKDITIPADKIKTGVQLHDYMVKELKLDQNTKEFGEAFKHFMTTMKLRMR